MLLLFLKAEHSVLRGLWNITLENYGPDLKAFKEGTVTSLDDIVGCEIQY